MRSIKTHFDRIIARNPYHGSYTAFDNAICGRKITRKSLLINFNNLVDKDDYDPKLKNKLINYLHSRTKHAEEGQLEGKKGRGAISVGQDDINLKLYDFGRV